MVKDKLTKIKSFENPDKAIELLDEYFPKGEKFSRRGEAMAILSIAFLEGREIGRKEKKK